MLCLLGVCSVCSFAVCLFNLKRKLEQKPNDNEQARPSACLAQDRVRSQTLQNSRNTRWVCSIVYCFILLACLLPDRCACLLAMTCWHYLLIIIFLQLVWFVCQPSIPDLPDQPARQPNLQTTKPSLHCTAHHFMSLHFTSQSTNKHRTYKHKPLCFVGLGFFSFLYFCFSLLSRLCVSPCWHDRKDLVERLHSELDEVSGFACLVVLFVFVFGLFLCLGFGCLIGCLICLFCW